MGYGTLYIVSTPIGNLGDMTYRAVETLKNAAVICCEDTRHTLGLLTHFGIKNRLISFHEHSPASRVEEIIAILKEGGDAALVTDAGTPIISDPGSPLTACAAEEGIEIRSVPGACAAIAALTVAAMDCRRFTFFGFLPRDKTRADMLGRVCACEYTAVLYESPHQLKKTLAELAARLGGRRIAIVRELTKIYEEVERTNAAEALAARADREIKGEHVIVIEAAPAKAEEQLSDEALLAMLNEKIAGGMSKKNAVQSTAEETGVSKNRIYRLSLL